LLLLSRIITKLSTKQADLSFAFDDAENLQAVFMTDGQMQETEGAVAPLVAVGVMMGTRFIAQRWVTQKVAQNMVKRGATNIMAPNRSIAKKNCRKQSHQRISRWPWFKIYPLSSEPKKRLSYLVWKNKITKAVKSYGGSSAPIT